MSAEKAKSVTLAFVGVAVGVVAGMIIFSYVADKLPAVSATA